MAKFKYKALHPSGRTLSGILEAQNIYDLTQLLEKSQITLLWARESRTFSWDISIFSRAPKPRDLIEFVFQLSRLLESGVPLLEGLQEIGAHLHHSPLRDVAVDIIREVEGGKSLSDAAAKHPKVFDEVARGLISVGEKTGKLGPMLNEVLNHLKWKDSIRRDSEKALRYPLLLSSLMMAAIVTLLVILVPQMVEFLTSLGVGIPTSTLILIGVADFLTTYGLFVLGGLGLFVLALIISLKHSENLRTRLETWVLRLPLYGNYIRKLALLRFSHVVSIMFKNGIDILECLKTARTVVKEAPLREEIERIETQVMGGKSLSSAISHFSEFSPLTQRMIKIGEQSSSLGDALTQVHEYYTQDIKNDTERFILYLEPALLVFVGAVITWIVMAMFWPLYEASSHMEAF